MLSARVATGSDVSPPQTGADPAVNRPYVNPEFEQWVARFERPGREVYDRRHEIITATGVQPGMVIADIGAGTGLFTRLFSAAVGPSGKVIAVDVSRVFIDNILRIARERGLGNVEGIVNTQTDTLLSAGSIDLAFLSDTYHHFEQPLSMMTSIHRSLRPGGTLVVIDFQKHGQSSDWVKDHVRAGSETVIEEIEAAGFEFAGQEKFLHDNYFLRFMRR
ncbi:MAG: methyltransferase domain-containing protein [Acidiferrobacterales bacterium]|nr:methyltransferase domain-containing protein [Acidiferrobacterales bacterium]